MNYQNPHGENKPIKLNMFHLSHHLPNQMLGRYYCIDLIKESRNRVTFEKESKIKLLSFAWNTKESNSILSLPHPMMNLLQKAMKSPSSSPNRIVRVILLFFPIISRIMRARLCMGPQVLNLQSASKSSSKICVLRTSVRCCKNSSRLSKHLKYKHFYYLQ